MSAGCRDCRAGLEHCHGTIIRHPRRRVECTEQDCPAPGLLPHVFAIDCDAIGCRCIEAIAVALAHRVGTG